MLVYIGDRDITKYIQDNSYDVNQEKLYTEWIDGNYKKHRLPQRRQIVGAFTVICSEKTITQAELLQLFEDNASNEVVEITLMVNNLARMESIQAFYNIKSTRHTDSMDLYEVTLEER